MTIQEIKKKFNTTKVVQVGDFLQVKHFQDNMFHYFSMNGGVWKETSMTSVHPMFKGDEE